MATELSNAAELNTIRELRDQHVRDWAKLTVQALRMRLVALNMHERVAVGREAKAAAREKHLYNSIGYNLKAPKRELRSLSFVFVRHGIYVEHGVGRGRPRNSAAANKAAKPWLSFVLTDARIGDLADIIARYTADEGAVTLKLTVPGIINTTIKSS